MSADADAKAKRRMQALLNERRRHALDEIRSSKSDKSNVRESEEGEERNQE
jgi:hypothetical protein